MPTDCLFREDSYLKNCEARVVGFTVQGGIVLNRTVFYANSGGQPGDTGALILADGTRMPVENTVFTDAGKSEIAHVVAAGAPALKAGDPVDRNRQGQTLRPHAHAHRAASSIGGAALRGHRRLGRRYRQPARFRHSRGGLDKDAITAQLAEMIATNAAVTSRWISDAELEANPGLIKTMSVKPPMGTGRVRLIEIAGLDLQPCGGTHVRMSAKSAPCG